MFVFLLSLVYILPEKIEEVRSLFIYFLFSLVQAAISFQHVGTFNFLFSEIRLKNILCNTEQSPSSKCAPIK